MAATIKAATSTRVDATDELVKVMHEGRIKLVRRGDLIDPAFRRAGASG
jgi:hypothetical protein